MNVRFHGRGRLAGAVREVVEHETTRLDRRLASMNDDLKSLDIAFEHHQRDDSYSARLRLAVPNQQLVTSGHGATKAVALREAFDDLDDTLERYLARLRGEPAMRREMRNERAALGDRQPAAGG